MKITMQLVDGASDHHIWAREYERDAADILKLQGELARAVADEIRTRLTPEERARLASGRTIDPAAHEAYLLGRYHAWKMNEDDLRLATSHFERAVQLDPQYAAAYADLSLAWQYRSVFGVTPYKESENPARSAAQMALALDRNLAAGHLAAGHLKYAYHLDFAGAEADLRLALDLEPHSVDAHYYYAKLLQSLGRLPEAIHHMELARELDPLSSTVASFFGRTLYHAEKYEEAIPHLKRAIELEPRNTLAHTRLIENYEELGRYDEILSYVAQEYERSGDPFYLLRKARLHARMGKPYEARRTLEHVDPSGRHPVHVATIYAALGDHDEAFRWLARAIDVRPNASLLFIKVHPPLAPLRADPRWGDVLGRLGLPH